MVVSVLNVEVGLAMVRPTTYVWIILALLVAKGLSLCYDDFCSFTVDNDYMTECIMHDPPTPVDYESRFLYEANYIVIYEGRVRWSGEKCKERKCVDVTEYRRAKAIVGETK